MPKSISTNSEIVSIFKSKYSSKTKNWLAIAIQALVWAEIIIWAHLEVQRVNDIIGIVRASIS